MKDDKIMTAEKKAKRFLARVQQLKARRAKADLYDFQGCVESGAVRRASMALTRALADLRKFP